jgi:hypothetical protein
VASADVVCILVAVHRPWQPVFLPSGGQGRQRGLVHPAAAHHAGVAATACSPRCGLLAAAHAQSVRSLKLFAPAHFTRFRLLCQVFLGKQTDVLQSVVASAASAACCFAVISSDLTQVAIGWFITLPFVSWRASRGLVAACLATVA